MKVAAVVCFILAAGVALLTIAATRAFGNEYGYQRTALEVVLVGAVFVAIPLLLGFWLRRKSR